MLEHQPAFMDGLRSGRKMRQRMFDAIEQQHGDHFSQGRVGKGLYEDLLSAVRESGVPEAVEEFEDRFFPLLHSAPPRRNADIAPPQEAINPDRATAVEHRRGGGWGGISALCVAALLAAAILGINVINMTAAERTAVKEADVPAAKPTVTASEIITERAQTLAGEATIAATISQEPALEGMTEPALAAAAAARPTTEGASETSIDPVPAISVEPGLSTER